MHQTGWRALVMAQCPADGVRLVAAGASSQTSLDRLIALRVSVTRSGGSTGASVTPIALSVVSDCIRRLWWSG